jgi:hypothetical protein
MFESKTKKNFLASLFILFARVKEEEEEKKLRRFMYALFFSYRSTPRTINKEI